MMVQDATVTEVHY